MNKTESPRQYGETCVVLKNATAEAIEEADEREIGALLDALEDAFAAVPADHRAVFLREFGRLYKMTLSLREEDGPYDACVAMLAQLEHV
jgi:hypothetical protein